MRVLLISDIHANLAALTAVLEHATSFGFDAVWCLGDLVGYGPRPNESIEMLLDQPVPVLCVAGNHDWACLGRVSLADFNPDARRACQWSSEILTEDNRAFLASLPVTLVEEEFTLVHGSPRHPVWEYVLYPEMAASNFAHYRTACCLVGHTHVPMAFQEPEDHSENGTEVISLSPAVHDFLDLEGGRFIINPGSVGQPRDGDARAGYALLDSDTMNLRFERVEYAVEVTQEQMLAEDLPPRLIARLLYGW